jgi:hypothetical protein
LEPILDPDQLNIVPTPTVISPNITNIDYLYTVSYNGITQNGWVLFGQNLVQSSINYKIKLPDFSAYNSLYTFCSIWVCYDGYPGYFEGQPVGIGINGSNIFFLNSQNQTIIPYTFGDFLIFQIDGTTCKILKNNEIIFTLLADIDYAYTSKLMVNITNFPFLPQCTLEIIAY